MDISHKKTFNALLLILVFLLALIATIFFTQQNSQKNIDGLTEANRNAAITFDINNRLQEIVNYSEVIERNSRNLFLTKDSKYLQGIEDTIAIIENHLELFKDISTGNNPQSDLVILSKLVEDKINHIKVFLINYKTKQGSTGIQFSDSTVAAGLNEKIYNKALSVQKSLENNLRSTLNQSNRLSSKILQVDKILSIIAIIAIVILGTFIINRLLQQLKLIDKLAKEKERADKSAIIKEQFLANMSHEIRTPINAVIGFSNLLQKTNLESDQHQFVDLIQKSGENLLAVVNDILDISKLEAGMMHFTKNPFSIREACTALEMMFYHKASEKGISFSCATDEEIPDILVGDAERLNQVLINLVNNAIKFTNEGEVDVSVILKKKTIDKVELIFSVKDSGIGIPQHKIDSVFERFEQADSETSRQFGGTGLGLSIVKKTVSLQGGSISVKSESGKGSEFIFSLSYDYIEDPEQLAAAINVNNQEKISFKNIKALIAEDNKTNQTLLKYTLKQWDLDYDLAENGVQAIELINKNKYDIVLMDIQMPLLDGYEAAKKIRKELNAVIPIVAMTAHVLPTEREKCINAGMNDYISKPLKEVEFLKILKKYLAYTTNKGSVTPVKKVVNNYHYINLKYLYSIFPGNEDFISEIMYQFREQYPKELAALQAEVERKSFDGVAGKAHHMKTTVSSLSIDTPLRIHLDKIKIAANENNWMLIQEEVNALVQKEAAVIKEVNAVITS